jgi:ribonuclease P protein component
VAAGARAHSSLLTLQSLARSGDPEGQPRFGMTVTRKTGGAVERNRMRRRLREALRRVASEHARRGHDYVVVARSPMLEAPFDQIITDLKYTLRRIHAAPGPRSRAEKAPTSGRTEPPLDRERADDVGTP